MANRAGLVLDGLVMERRNFGRAEVVVYRVALQAERVYVALCQQSRILRTVRGVTRSASLYLDRWMFENERPRCLCMTLHADRVLEG